MHTQELSRSSALLLLILAALALTFGGCITTSGSRGMKDASGRGASNANGKNTLVKLALDLDAVTAATPGYRRGRATPPHLRKEKKRKPFMVVPGLENLALFKPVSASGKPTMGELEQLTDGIKTSGEFDIVEGPGWVQVDLGRTASIHAIVIWHYYKNPVIYDDVIVSVSTEEDFSDNVTTLFNNDHDNSSGMGRGTDTAYISRWWGEIIDARTGDRSGTEARFVRLYTRGTVDGKPPRYVEIAVYGKPLGRG